MPVVKKPLIDLHFSERPGPDNAKYPILACKHCKWAKIGIKMMKLSLISSVNCLNSYIYIIEYMHVTVVSLPRCLMFTVSLQRKIDFYMTVSLQPCNPTS